MRGAGPAIVRGAGPASVRGGARRCSVHGTMKASQPGRNSIAQGAAPRAPDPLECTQYPLWDCAPRGGTVPHLELDREVGDDHSPQDDPCLPEAPPSITTPHIHQYAPTHRPTLRAHHARAWHRAMAGHGMRRCLGHSARGARAEAPHHRPHRQRQAQHDHLCMAERHIALTMPTPSDALTDEPDPEPCLCDALTGELEHGVV